MGGCRGRQRQPGGSGKQGGSGISMWWRVPAVPDRPFPPPRVFLRRGGGYVLGGNVARVLVEAHARTPLRFSPIEDATVGHWLTALDLRTVRYRPRLLPSTCTAVAAAAAAVAAAAVGRGVRARVAWAGFHVLPAVLVASCQPC